MMGIVDRQELNSNLKRTCLICRTSEKIGKQSELNVQKIKITTKELNKQFKIFCDYMKLNMSFISFGEFNFLVDSISFPFCINCQQNLSKLIKLHDELQLIIRKIDKVTSNFSKKILESRNQDDDDYVQQENKKVTTTKTTQKGHRQYFNRRLQKVEITKRTICKFRKFIFDRYNVQLSLNKLDSHQHESFNKILQESSLKLQNLMDQPSPNLTIEKDDDSINLNAEIKNNQHENEHSYSLLHYSNKTQEDDDDQVKNIVSSSKKKFEKLKVTSKNRGTVELTPNKFVYRGQHYFEKIGTKFNCSSCGYSCSLQKLLIGHIRYKHLESSPCVCQECGKSFRHKIQLSMHQDIHSQENRFACKDCHQKFRTSNSLYKHRKKIHLPPSQPQFKCDHCDKKCFEKTQLKLHLRTHTGETPYECEICLKKFKTSSQIGRHKKIHILNNKPHECHLCHLKFTEMGSVRRHVREIHEQEPRKRSTQGLSQQPCSDTYQEGQKVTEI